jgi:hypothetical protein
MKTIVWLVVLLSAIALTTTPKALALDATGIGQQMASAIRQVIIAVIDVSDTSNQCPRHRNDPSGTPSGSRTPTGVPRIPACDRRRTGATNHPRHSPNAAPIHLKTAGLADLTWRRPPKPPLFFFFIHRAVTCSHPTRINHGVAGEVGLALGWGCGIPEPLGICVAGYPDIHPYVPDLCGATLGRCRGIPGRTVPPAAGYPGHST